MTKSFKEQEESIAKLENRLLQLKSQQKQTARKRDTRRLVLMGRLLERLIEWGKVDGEMVRKKMDGYLTYDHDRELFDLPPKETAKTAEPKATTNQAKKSTARKKTAPDSAPALPSTPSFVPPAHMLKSTVVSPDDFVGL
jgi:hypothetical protein